MIDYCKHTPEDYGELVKQSHFVKINSLILTTTNGDEIILDLDKMGKAEFQYKFLKSFIEGIVSRKNVFYQDLDEKSKAEVMNEYTNISQMLVVEKSALKKKVNKLIELSLQFNS